MRIKGLIVGFIAVILSAGMAVAQQLPPPLSLEEAVRIALEKNLSLVIAREGVLASQNRQNYAFSQFFPTWTGSYNYQRFDSPLVFETLGTRANPQPQSTSDTSTFSTTINQPVFTGGNLTANYRFESLGVDISKTNVETARRNIIQQVRAQYFLILTAQHGLEVSQQAVKNFQAQLATTQAFFDVGIVAKNDVLLAEVQLAQAVQNQYVAENQLEVARSTFNNLLRRDINAPVVLVDILAYQPFKQSLDDSLYEALRQRPEIKAANLTVDQARESVAIAQSNYFPNISVLGNYNNAWNGPALDAQHSNEKWSVTALATLTFSDWFRQRYRVGEQKVRALQAQEQRNQVVDNVLLEVKQSYINIVQAEKNINVALKSTEQAEENLRLNEERYRYQVATATDLLNAVTLLAQARLNYYNTLGVYNIAKAALERAMGRVYP
jgi:outer membrane protein